MLRETTRRGFLRIGSLGLAGLTLSDLLRLRAAGAVDENTRHKAIIVVFLNGGPSQLDMFDMKPQAPAEFRGEFRPISTNVAGTQICELLPKHARMMDKMTIVNGLQVITSGHSLYEASTGFTEENRPSIGAVVSRFGQRVEGMPPWVSNGGHSDPGFLGPKYAAFNPNGGMMRDLYSKGIDRGKVKLLRDVDRLNLEIDTDDDLLTTDTFTERVLKMLGSTKVREAFDVREEPAKIRERYGGRGYGGTNLLQALRLAEAGVGLITCYGPGNNKWDTHKDNFKTNRDSILPHYDTSVTAMIEDLYARGLDKDVLIALYGEFGRTPRVNKNAGRDHYPQSGFVQLVGGGLKMGQTIGDTGKRGDFDISRSRPYTIQNLIATFYHILGIDPSIKVFDNFGRPQYLLEQREPIRELL